MKLSELLSISGITSVRGKGCCSLSLSSSGVKTSPSHLIGNHYRTVVNMNVTSSVSDPLVVATLASWGLIETVGNVLLGLCIYYERVHNRRLYRGYRDKMVSAGASVFLLYNLCCSPLYAYRAVSGQALPTGICLYLSLFTIYATCINTLFLLNYLLSVLVDSLPLGR